MHKNILVIGGTRYFGKLLVQRLVRAGHRVTIATRGYAPDPFGPRIERIRVDRRNETAMRAAFLGARYDLVFDQMCYSPLDAAIAVRTFAGKVARYVLTSTIDVYRGIHASGPAVRETDLPVLAQRIDTGYPGMTRRARSRAMSPASCRRKPISAATAPCPWSRCAWRTCWAALRNSPGAWPGMSSCCARAARCPIPMPRRSCRSSARRRPRPFSTGWARRTLPGR
ncbi:NAD-dependent epimerase/dehydratase family protein [Massilia sp. Dwa41.01b]|uniref:NAD-dependent epimerase/dehydratase family protein n=1 Tax=Massilia sp. Dwa41.01b TaxID=2709302 RepID=UPI001E5EC644|nr:NAD-dependent epimerase/dehydratase family protein [Massilia sp. Dwa41.01b]